MPRAVPRRLYGLGVLADVPVAALDGLEPAARCDVRWSVGRLPDCGEWLEYARVEESNVRAARSPLGDHLRLAYDDGSTFVIDRAGSQVWALAPPGATVEDLATYLLGPVMGFVLRLRGVTCLHAASVAVDGRAILVAGHAGSGKSSTAAAFARAGHPVMGDDVAALCLEGDDCCVEASYRRVRLWPESVQALYGSADALPRITPTWSKRFLGLEGASFHPGRLPLAAIHVLDDRAGAEARIERLDPASALIWLVAHAYSARLLDRSMRAREFECLARVVRRVPVWRVAPAEGFTHIDRLCEALAARAHAPI